MSKRLYYMHANFWKPHLRSFWPVCFMWACLCWLGACSVLEPKVLETVEEESDYVVPSFLGGGGLKQSKAYQVKYYSNQEGIYSLRHMEFVGYFVYDEDTHVASESPTVFSKVEAIWTYNLQSEKVREVVFAYRNKILTQATFYEVHTDSHGIESRSFQEVHRYHYEGRRLSYLETYDEADNKRSETRYRYAGNRLTQAKLYDAQGELFWTSTFFYDEEGRLMRSSFYTPHGVRIYEIDYVY